MSWQGHWKQRGLTSMAWADVSLFLPRVAVVRVCSRISVRQPDSVRELGKGCPCSLLCCPQSCQLWKELAGRNVQQGPAAIALVQMSYHLPLISEPELYFLLFLCFLNFPTGGIIICLPCLFSSNSASRPRAGPLFPLLLGELCHRLPPGSAGG